ncbi:hypothetical protein BAUCODRAFT_501409 [Baudoinia panamericana UAMH 10762]|uniref:Uncharacterized protein n=1 Tax=Baudoinia panamericana (strain UAMH 10762) TaxID=717646 RepID=M2N9E4_BAUPA|nr:uncharacterized protein BAUCODRAFT_501409 [Baudoinia panamericana UAMH 10762]EMC95729.1 hypothetical protein BAUCODRAFT_501409 [Baudoinia panamericana UAMH 10762]
MAPIVGETLRPMVSEYTRICHAAHYNVLDGVREMYVRVRNDFPKSPIGELARGSRILVGCPCFHNVLPMLLKVRHSLAVCCDHQ